ncbi:MAG: hypothetical protein ABIT96_10060 [Ferruginibacter sp.]
MLIPLYAMLNRKNQPGFMQPVSIYIAIALALNIIINFVISFNRFLPEVLTSNNPLYNVQSLVRLTCFGIFFLQLPGTAYHTFRKWSLLAAGIIIIGYFIFVENFFNYDYLSSNLLTAESYLLLIFCIQYYLAELRNDAGNIFDGPAFWVVTGLAIYVVVNFFVFLFYQPMLEVNSKLSENMWNVHNIAFIIFCIFIAKAYYGTARN